MQVSKSKAKRCPTVLGRTQSTANTNKSKQSIISTFLIYTSFVYIWKIKGTTSKISWDVFRSKLTTMFSCTFRKGWVGRGCLYFIGVCPLIVFSLWELTCMHCIWHCGHARFCVESFMHYICSFIHSFIQLEHNWSNNKRMSLLWSAMPHDWGPTYILQALNMRTCFKSHVMMNWSACKFYSVGPHRKLY